MRSDGRDIVNLYSVVFSIPNEEGIAADRVAHFNLIINVGKVMEIRRVRTTTPADGETKYQDEVLLHYYYSTSKKWTGRSAFVPWRQQSTNKEEEQLSSWIAVDDLLQDSFKMIAVAEVIVNKSVVTALNSTMSDQITLSKDTLVMVYNIFKLDDDSNNDTDEYSSGDLKDG